ncbi:hypothetical protein [Synechocystis salina]|uniref:hypothetical protein n=1 Tax=Synechocystis salina TaxID=945780 RepID=UPI001D146AA3|nr:hypothetical protein [Synechocystis salina]
MSDSRLNLVAIAIFLMMMSALVGPIVHLSPAIPAVATLAILGIITADQISWQGRGTDFLSVSSKPNRKKRGYCAMKRGIS